MEQTIEGVLRHKKYYNRVADHTLTSDVEAGIEFIYNMREHLLDIGIATIYGLLVYAAVLLWITKKIKG